MYQDCEVTAHSIPPGYAQLGASRFPADCIESSITQLQATLLRACHQPVCLAMNNVFVCYGCGCGCVCVGGGGNLAVATMLLRYCITVWLVDNLVSGTYIPSINVPTPSA
jgi:hypothetical protein